jgi:hypothetical protein
MIVTDVLLCQQDFRVVEMLTTLLMVSVDINSNFQHQILLRDGATTYALTRIAIYLEDKRLVGLRTVR